LLPLPGRPSKHRVAAFRQDPEDDESLAIYWTFYRAVASAQLSRWLPRRSSRVLDLSGAASRAGFQAAAAGHKVLEVVSSGSLSSSFVSRVVGDAAALDFLADSCIDAVIAEDRMLSRCLATEATVAEIARVLRPGGRVLLSVDSLMLGMAVLAEQNLWPHLSDVPKAEVVLVPWPDGTITRCFWADQVRELLVQAGLEVEWIRPRTIVSPSTAEHVLALDPGALPRLVRTELSAPHNSRGDEDARGIHLLASAVKLGG
jgi:SAM-dependent methyltransferase